LAIISSIIFRCSGGKPAIWLHVAHALLHLAAAGLHLVSDFPEARFQVLGTGGASEDRQCGGEKMTRFHEGPLGLKKCYFALAAPG
jgi:hypothetical protein